MTLIKKANRLRVSMDAANYKHIVLGLIFLKYVSDTFNELRQRKHSSLSYQNPEQIEQEYYTNLTNSVCRQIGPPQRTKLFLQFFPAIRGGTDKAAATLVLTKYFASVFT